MSPTAVLVLLALAAPIAPSARDLAGRGRFIVATPDRLAMPGDRQEPRRYDRIESAVGAYADIDEVADATWLRHEIAGYALRAGRCVPPGPERCRAAARRLGDAMVLQVISGGHAEVLWTAGHHAVRLGWRRVVETATGTMTVDDPPAPFAAELLAALPSDLAAIDLDPAAWADADVDRRLDYADRALASCAMASDTTGCLHFARASLLAVEAVDPALPDPGPATAAPPTVVSVRLRIAATRLRRADDRESRLAPPMCLVPDLLAPSRLAALP